LRRPHAAEEVYVTGTFDNWSKSERLDKVGDHFEKTVTLPNSSEPIFYKVRTSFITDFSLTRDRYHLSSSASLHRLEPPHFALFFPQGAV
jgi:hypothetical protein